jgi:hypothetical protein
MNQLPNHCPICSAGDLVITGFYCRECDTRVEGRFVTSVPFAQLTPEQLHFMETFVRCEGKITRVEEELGLSYPTIRNRLHDVIRALGYEPGQDEQPAAGVSESDRRGVLDRLERGEITYDEAMRLLQGE